jgi:3-isopropylmalate/(R)-2-methylmalate dehydratase small subunit
MQPFTRLTGVAAPLIRDDVNTDEITPIQIARQLKPDYAELLFMRERRRADGSLDPDFVFNRPQFRRPAILVTGRNFGCGSSRESAVWAMLAVGIRAIVARSFADIYRENCLQNGVLPVELGDADADALTPRVVAADGAVYFTADLEAQRISGPGGPDIAFEISAAERLRLLEGLDDIGLTLKHEAEIATFEARVRGERPWQQTAADSRSLKGQ